MSTTPPGDLLTELTKTRKERDFYRALVDLGQKEAIEPLLDQALKLIVDVAGARRGYLEIRADAAGKEGPRWSMARGSSDEEVEAIRERMSSGVIAEALATGQTISTASARSDKNLGKHGSVQELQIESVLCAPIGSPDPIGVVYLQDRIVAGTFSEEDRLHAEAFARQLAPLADRLVIRRARAEATDPTRPYRETMNVTRFIGRSNAVAKVLEEVKRVGPRAIAVLLRGETGTGKTDVARVIHDNGPRAHRPFVEVNCATLTEALAASDLFGSEVGAYTSATRKILGKVPAAKDGTFFLDEVGDLSLPVQAQLLQFLNSKDYYSVGTSQIARSKARIIAATNKDLEELVATKQFREDLLFRLQGYLIRIPTLDERKEDIADLMAFFCARECEENEIARLELSPGAVRAAEAAAWPGNIRQLAQRVGQAVIRAANDGALAIERRHLFPDETKAPGSTPSQMTLQEALLERQREVLITALENEEWNVVKAAEAIDVKRSTFYNLIKAHGLARKKK